jgi:hypothetical protein
MFKQLKEGEMYLITDLLKQDKEDNIVWLK